MIPVEYIFESIPVKEIEIDPNHDPKNDLCFYCKKPLQLDKYTIERFPEIKAYSCDCGGHTSEQEQNAVEEYNKQFNDKLSLRKTTNLITCPKCNRTGRMNVDPKLDIRCIGCWCDSDCLTMKCDKCKGEGYVNSTT
jgi:hypothetical protein